MILTLPARRLLGASITALVLFSFTPAAVAQTLDRLEAVHPYGTPQAVSGSNNGQFLYLGEGGSIAFVNVAQGQAGFDTPVKRVPVGRFGVRPTELKLDPGAGSLIGGDRLYVAGGQQGLWVMESGVAPQLRNKAARVDDARRTDSLAQNSLRYCNAVDVMTVAGTQYLVALFSAKYDTHLRVYPLADVRAVLDASDDDGLGAELSAACDVRLIRHPQAPTEAPTQAARPFGLGIAIDPVSSTPGNQVADVYVAMGPHGVVRVRYDATSFPAPVLDAFGNNLAVCNPVFVQWGPRFGDGTSYAAGNPLYSHYAWVDQFATPNVTLREDPPNFVDVAIQNDARGHFLYCAVGHLNWVQFDLANPWSPDMPIRHHEGVEVPTSSHPWGERMIQASPWADPVKPWNYCRVLEVLSRGARTVLVSSLSTDSFARRPDQIAPGFSLDNSWGHIGGVHLKTHAACGGDRPWTLIHDTATLTSSFTLNALQGVPAGGRNLFLPGNQTNLHALSLQVGQDIADDVLIEFVHNNEENFEDTGTTYEIACYSAFNLGSSNAGDSEGVFIRGAEDLYARFTNGIAATLVNPDVLITAHNDGRVSHDGILVTEEPQPGVTQVSTHQLPFVDDDRFETGATMDGRSQWHHPTATSKQYVWGGGKEGVFGQDDEWKIMRLDIPQNQIQTSPIEEFRWFIEMPVDRWNREGRAFYIGGSLDERYDESVGGGWVWGTRQSVPDGLIMMNRDAIMDVFDGVGGPLPDLTEVHPSTIPNLDMLELGTHPEFDNFPWGTQPGAGVAQSWWNNVNNTELRGGFNTFPPRLARVRSDGSDDLDAWVLIVPCGKVSCSSSFDIFQSQPGWVPDAEFEDHFDHSMVQFWDVTDPNNVPMALPPNDPNYRGNSPLPRLFGPEPGGLNWQIKAFVHGEKTLLLTADFGLGSVQLYDISDILQNGGTAPVLLNQLVMPRCLFDDLPNNARSLAVDLEDPQGVKVYIGVPRLGILVAKIDDSAPNHPRLRRIGLIETSGEPWWLSTRYLRDGTRQLMVADGPCGMRFYGAPVEDVPQHGHH